MAFLTKIPAAKLRPGRSRGSPSAECDSHDAKKQLHRAVEEIGIVFVSFQ